jgi:hypothetical protein
MQLYVNGTVEASNSFTGTMNNGDNQDFWVGRIYNNVSHFTGSMDEMLISSVQKSIFDIPTQRIKLYRPLNGTYYQDNLTFIARWLVNDTINDAVFAINNGTNVTITGNHTFNATYGYNNITIWYQSDVWAEGRRGFHVASAITPSVNVSSENCAWGFRHNRTCNMTIRISNPLVEDVTCNITLNNITVNEAVFSPTNRTFGYNVVMFDGLNNFSTSCVATGNVSNKSNQMMVYLKNYTMINEYTGSVFTQGNESIKVTSIDRQLNYTINTTGNTTGSEHWFFYMTNTTDSLRFEIEYPDLKGTIYRDFAPDLEETNSTRVCVSGAATYQEQLIYASIKRPVALWSSQSDCYVLKDYTRYAYSDALMIRAYTLPEVYFLYVWDDGAVSLLSNFEGNVAQIVNLDLVEWASTPRDFDITNEGLGISANSTTVLKITYYDPNQDNTQIEFTMKNGSATIWTYTETINPNNVTIYFSHAAYNLTNELMTLEVRVSDPDGVHTITRLFYVTGVVGFLNPYVAMLLSGVLVFFGFTFVAVRHAFGIFGMVIILIAIAITTLAPSNQYLLFMQVVYIIMLLFTLILYKEEYAKMR